VGHKLRSNFTRTRRGVDMFALNIATTIITCLLIVLNIRMTYISGDVHPFLNRIFRLAYPAYPVGERWWIYALQFLQSWLTVYAVLMLLFVPFLNIFLAISALFMSHSMLHLKHPIKLLKICFRKKAFK
jgi:hypothetical protein